MIKGIIGFVVETAIYLSLGTAVFSQIYHEVRKTALTEVYNSLHSKNNLETFTAKMTGQKSWLDTPSPKNILLGIGNRD